jgi:MFS family permease
MNAAAPARLRDDVFAWSIALATGLDYFDNAIFAFFTSYIAGGINASADELVWASSAYAVASVLGILQQQWWIERLGFRRYIAGCLLFFSVGAIAAALSESSLELALARGFQGYFIGPMMSACRILIQSRITPQRRPVAIRLFLFMILIGSGLAPLAGGYLVAWFDWRALFTCTVSALACSRFLPCRTRGVCSLSNEAMRISGRTSSSRLRKARCKSRCNKCVSSCSAHRRNWSCSRRRD